MGSIGGVFGSTQSGRKEAKPISVFHGPIGMDPEKNMTSPKSSKFCPLRAVLVGLGFWLFGEETTAWSEDAATPSSWMDAMMA